MIDKNKTLKIRLIRIFEKDGFGYVAFETTKENMNYLKGLKDGN